VAGDLAQQGVEPLGTARYGVVSERRAGGDLMSLHGSLIERFSRPGRRPEDRDDDPGAVRDSERRTQAIESLRRAPHVSLSEIRGIKIQPNGALAQGTGL
jgi:hypothetical protein